MMKDPITISDPEINSLFQLLDDPDEMVYGVIAQKILSYGTNILDALREFSDTVMQPLARERAIRLIQNLALNENLQKWKDWKASKEKADIFATTSLIGEMLDSQYDADHFSGHFKKLKQNLWLELNLYMTPLEVFHAVTSIIYSQYSFKIIDSQQTGGTAAFHPGNIFDSKSVNQYLFALIIQSIMDELDTPVKTIKLPFQLMLVYYELQRPFKISDVEKQEKVYRLSAFLDPKTAEVFAENEIDMFFKKIDLKAKKEHFLPLSHWQLTFLILVDLYKMLEQQQDNHSELVDHLKNIIQVVFETNPEKL